MSHNISSKPHVMLVDDEEIIVDLARELLADLPIELTTAMSGQEVLGRITEGRRVDLLLCDLNMPDMDGIELIRHLAMQNFQGAIALISAEDKGILDTAGRLAAAHRLRVVGVLSKPLKRAAVQALLDQLDLRQPTLKAQEVSTDIEPEELAHAISTGQMTGYYQPKVSIAQRTITGLECLARWQHPQRGLIYPGDFVPLAEANGLIPALTQAMFRVAFNQVAEWSRQGLFLTVSVNVCITDLADVSFPDMLQNLSRETGVPLSQIVIEVTESQILDRLYLTLDTLARLRLKGVGLAIDDFGTGFASLEQLSQIPFTQLKVDRQFVCGASGNDKLRAILETSLDLGARLGLSTVAEGVETAEDLDLLRRLGCQEVQGYFIARPMPAARVPAWSAQWQAGLNDT